MKKKHFGLLSLLMLKLKSKNITSYHLVGMVAFIGMAIFAFVQGAQAEGLTMMTAGVGATVAEQEALLKTIKEKNGEQFKELKTEVSAMVTEAFEKGYSKTELDKRLGELEEKFKDNVDKATLKTIQDNIKEVADRQKEFGKEIKKIQSPELSGNNKAQFEKDLTEWISGEAFKSWRDDGEQKGKSPALTLKYSITVGRTGNVLVSSRSNRVSDEFQPRKSHVRDLMTVIPTDMTTHVFDKVTAWVPGIDVIGENGEAPTFDVTTEEQSVNFKRVAGKMDVSNNVMKSAMYLVNHILNRAPERLLNIEDFQILFGDGNGNNVQGIYNQATTFDLTGPSFIAGAVASIASYDGGASTEVTFAASHNLSNAYVITFASSTNYNNAYAVNVKSATKIIVSEAYQAETATSWTATTKHSLYQSVDGAQEWDVLMAAKAFMANSEYQLTAYVLNPATAAKIEMLKATDLQYVGRIERINGMLVISGIPVIEHNSIPADRFLGGDFQAAVELLQYEDVTLRFVEDTEYVAKNKQLLYIAEQILLPVYNPFMFVKGVFSTAKTALETP